MNKISDEKIINQIKKDCNYEIKLKSESILNQYNYEVELEAQRKKSAKKKRRIAIGSIFGGLTAVGLAAIVGVVLLKQPKQEIIDKPIVVVPDTNPLTNKQLRSQLITFQAFNLADDSSAISNLNMMRLNTLDDEDDEEDNKNVLLDDLVKPVTLFDEVHSSIAFMYSKDDILTENKESGETFDGVTFEYVTEFKYKDANSDPFAYYYYNAPTETVDDEDKTEIKRVSKAYYICDSGEYKVHVKDEIEKDKDESETETKLVLQHTVDGTIFKIEKETETSTENKTESENSFTLETYKSSEDYDDGNFIRSVSLETEVEGNEQEIELSIEEDGLEANFDINKINEKLYELTLDYENDEIEISDVLIKLIVEESSRKYTYQDNLILEK